MPILNYTTKMSVEQTVNDIQKILVKAKASAILTEYGPDGNPSAISFHILLNKNDVKFRLPVDVDGVTRTLRFDKRYKNEAHARRVAWRIVKDWIDAQMALIYAQMADLGQVFLPYATNDRGESFYSQIKKSGFMQLAPPKD